MEFFIDLVHLIVEHFLFTYQPAFNIFDKCSLSRLEIAASVFDELMRRKNFINNFYSQSIIMLYLQIVKEFLDSIVGNERKSQFYLTFFTNMKDKVFFTHNIRFWPVCIFFCDLHSYNSVSLCSYHLRRLFLGYFRAIFLPVEHYFFTCLIHLVEADVVFIDCILVF